MSAAIGLKLAPETEVPAPHGSTKASESLDPTFRQVYAEHFQLVWRGLKRLGVNESLLEDAVQDVFVVVHRRLAEFERRSSLKTWVYGIAVRVAKDYRRTEQRRSRRVQKFAELSKSEPVAQQPSDAAERREANRILHRALGELDDELRAVLVLIEFEQLSVREAAGALNLQPRTCQRRIKKARAEFEAAVHRHLVPPRSPP
jgi:RNA polymerase sigma-70 factor (ECF subfamily)